MFYDVYKELCEKHGEKPYKLPLKLGAKSNSVVAQWKKGSTPRPEMLNLIAEYFNVSVGYLMDGQLKEEKPPHAMREGEIGPNKLALLNFAETLNEEEAKAFLEFVKAMKKRG